MPNDPYAKGSNAKNSNAKIYFLPQIEMQFFQQQYLHDLMPKSYTNILMPKTFCQNLNADILMSKSQCRYFNAEI